MSEIFLAWKNNMTLKQAIMEDNGESCWIYLLSENNEIIADCWLYNRIEAPDMEDTEKYKNGPPPASNKYTNNENRILNPNEEEFDYLFGEE